MKHTVLWFLSLILAWPVLAQTMPKVYLADAWMYQIASDAVEAASSEWPEFNAVEIAPDPTGRLSAIGILETETDPARFQGRPGWHLLHRARLRLTDGQPHRCHAGHRSFHFKEFPVETLTWPDGKEVQAIVPQSLEARDIGFILELTARSAPRGESIELTLQSSLDELTDWIPDRGMRHPIYSVLSSATTMLVEPGQTMFHMLPGSDGPTRNDPEDADAPAKPPSRILLLQVTPAP